MKRTRPAILAMALMVATASAEPAPLLSWSDSPSKKAILDFVGKVTTNDTPSFVPPAERIAVFDNDGTLWSEQPYYNQVAFTLDRIKALADKHPEWKEKTPFKHVLAGDVKAALSSGELGIAMMVAATHANITSEEFHSAVKDWLDSARHPRFKRPYTELVYQPMLELLAYLRANGFKTYIVSGGTVEFMRVFAEKVYGVPPEQVIGTTFKLKFEVKDGEPILMRLPEIDHLDDGTGKPISIQNIIVDSWDALIFA